MAHHIKNEACPKCRADGNDRAGDNLAQYSDGSSYCWRCGHWNNDNLSARQLLDRNIKHVPKEYPRIVLPDDASIDYPGKCIQWLEQFHLTKQDLLNNGVLWSESIERLIFPFWVDNELIAWQGRYFGNDAEKIKKNKWFSRGELQKLYYIFFNGRRVGHTLIKTSPLVLVEDVISAIKVSKAGINSMPLFGVNVKSRMPQIRVLNYVEAILWLDPDQYIKMIKECNRERLNGFKMHPVLSDKDPKYYTVEEIKKWLKVE